MSTIPKHIMNLAVAYRDNKLLNKTEDFYDAVLYGYQLATDGLEQLMVCSECGHISTDELKEMQSCCPDSNLLPLRGFIKQWLEEIVTLKKEKIKLLNYELFPGRAELKEQLLRASDGREQEKDKAQLIQTLNIVNGLHELCKINNLKLQSSLKEKEEEIKSFREYMLIRIEELERELKEKDQEIERLKRILDEISSACNDNETSMELIRQIEQIIKNNNY